MGYIPTFAKIMLLQGSSENFADAAKTFFRFYRADPATALEGTGNWSEGVLRAIQNVVSNSGHYHGIVDGSIGKNTRAAISAYMSGKPAMRPAQTGAGGDNVKVDLATKLQKQLQRVGCYHGSIDGKWGNGSSRALRNFNHWAGRKLPVTKPTPQALRAVTGERGAVCGVD